MRCLHDLYSLLLYDSFFSLFILLPIPFFAFSIVCNFRTVFTLCDTVAARFSRKFLRRRAPGLASVTAYRADALPRFIRLEQASQNRFEVRPVCAFRACCATTPNAERRAHEQHVV